MLAAIWGIHDFHLLDLMPVEYRFNAQYFVERVMAPLVQTIFPQGRIRYTLRLNVHLDNGRVHFSKVTEQFFIENQLLLFPTLLIVLTWSPRTSGYSGMSRLNSLAEASPSPKNC
jgi:hypothetical protein